MENITAFVFVMARMSGCVLFNPIFARKNVPNIVKSALVLVLSVFLYVTIPFEVPRITTTIEYMVLISKEFIVGFVIGYIVSLFGYVIILGGEMIDFQIGIAMAKVFDPQTNMQVALSSGFYNITYMLLFLGINGHITLIKIFLTTAKILPFGNIIVGTDLPDYILQIFCDCTVLAVKFAMPIVAVGIMVEMGVGILMKLIPQINVFVLNIQIKLIVGLIGMIAIYYPLADFLEKMIVTMFDAIEISMIYLTK
ncbi:MAG: flagellar biosynthetic protein FliR [Oscillospiraceae bacterium]